MHFLRDNPLTRYFAALDAIDRATFFIVCALCLALGLIITALTRHEVETSTPAFFVAPQLDRLATAAGARS